jgi:predicted ATPase
VTALCDRLADTSLLALTGLGGVGKSRLAIEVARATFDRRFQEVWLVELAASSDPADLPSAVASVLDVPEGSETPLLTSLMTALADRKRIAKSLVIAEERDGAVRYRQLETVRQYSTAGNAFRRTASSGSGSPRRSGCSGIRAVASPKAAPG